jgi:hypothetical protein
LTSDIERGGIGPAAPEKKPSMHTTLLEQPINDTNMNDTTTYILNEETIKIKQTDSIIHDETNTTNINNKEKITNNNENDKTNDKVPMDHGPNKGARYGPMDHGLNEGARDGTNYNTIMGTKNNVRLQKSRRQEGFTTRLDTVHEETEKEINNITKKELQRPRPGDLSSEEIIKGVPYSMDHEEQINKGVPYSTDQEVKDSATLIRVEGKSDIDRTTKDEEDPATLTRAERGEGGGLSPIDGPGVAETTPPRYLATQMRAQRIPYNQMKVQTRPYQQPMEMCTLRSHEIKEGPAIATSKIWTSATIGMGPKTELWRPMTGKLKLKNANITNGAFGTDESRANVPTTITDRAAVQQSKNSSTTTPITTTTIRQLSGRIHDRRKVSLHQTEETLLWSGPSKKTLLSTAYFTKKKKKKKRPKLV